MKIGIVGKGGVGKTTLSALICEEYRARGRRVLAIDTDSNPNLAISLGLDEDTANQAPVVPRSLAVGGMAQWTPERLIETFGLPTPSGVTLLHAMRVDQAGAGCTCTSHAAVRSILGSTIEELADVTLVDMEAGLEHLSRSGGTLAYADILLMVMEPTQKSILTAARTITLAEELGIARMAGIGNKAKLPADAEFFEKVAGEFGVPLAGIVPFDAQVPAADRRGTALTADEASDVRRAVAAIVDFVESPDAERTALLLERDRIERRLIELKGN
ncbi:MAG: AAA family ATPase [Acidimicrobiales bacterium]|nr:AAA family ATPase [Actinomycetota bacterium]